MLLKAVAATLVALSLAWPSASMAASTQVNFLVTVSLRGFCISSSLSQQTNALVRVTCQGNEFVNIEARPGQAFVGTHGGAHRFALYRYGFSGTRPERTDGFIGIQNAVDDWTGSGTITGLRVLNLTERDERLELLVSF